jgi:hypothetical protein
MPVDYCGTISLEPLVSSKPGPPVYLATKLSEAQRREYGVNLRRVSDRFAAMAKETPEKRRIAFILRAIDNVQKDLSNA